MPDRRSARRAVVGAAAFFVLGILGIWATANVVQVTRVWEFDDVHAYLGAAARLRDGGPLYITAQDLSDLYLYSPWFAFAWMPLLALPTLAVEIAWAVVLVAAMAAALWRVPRTWTGLAVALLLGSLLYRTVGWGNVQPLLVAFLVFAVPTRAGPVAIGLAWSLKPLALLAVAVYAWRNDWASTLVSLGVGAALWALAFAFNWTDYPAGARAPNIYDTTFLLALPALLASRRAATPTSTKPI